MSRALRALWFSMLAAGLTAAAEVKAPVATAVAPAVDVPAANAVHARLDLSQLVTRDDQGSNQVIYTDLRVVGDASRLGGTKVSFHLDGRGRVGWNEVSPRRLTVTEAYFRYGEEADDWRFSLGRQVIRQVASAEVDGLGVERQFGKNVSAVAFAGLMPHPLTADPNLDFMAAGLGYDGRGERMNHNGGAAVSLYRGGLNRFYLTQNSYVALSPQVVASVYALVDLVSPQGMLSTGPGPDLTSLNVMVRVRPIRSLDSTLAVNHNHTLLPGKWWHDWLTEQQRAQGFLLDGDEPVGTRITSARWTNVYWLTRELAPYLRLRYDVRHTEKAQGFEGAAGIKWRPKIAYVEASGSYRRFFGAEGQLLNLQAGVDAKAWGLEAGASALWARPLQDAASTLSYEVHAFAWTELGEFIAGAKGIRALAQYQAFIQPTSTAHAFMGQLGYRF